MKWGQPSLQVIQLGHQLRPQCSLGGPIVTVPPAQPPPTGPASLTPEQLPRGNLASDSLPSLCGLESRIMTARCPAIYSLVH